MRSHQLPEQGTPRAEPRKRKGSATQKTHVQESVNLDKAERTQCWCVEVDEEEMI